MRKTAAAAALAAAFHLTPLAPTAYAAPLEYYFPGETYLKEVPEPAAVLGHEVGEWHLRPDQIVHYLQVLAAASDRVTLEVIGHTYERRPLLLLTITTPGNHRRLEEIRETHLARIDPRRGDDGGGGGAAARPLVVNLGYSVHGNEPSGGNASVLVAYHLAASRSKAVGKLLDETVILLDPCLNPDGFGRFAGWANSHRGKHPVAAAVSREHNEVWPGGRTNHYWFDLNRDWLLAQHPESVARLAHFHRWRPNVLADFHEMGSDSTYFFQPGVPSRKNPLTPGRNVDLTAQIAAYHADALDALGVLYYNEERFDDFYYGKGSTYPDVHGGVGILFEQASSRGHLRESIHGEFDFASTVRNQVATSLSTLAGAADLREELLDYQREFYRSALALADADRVRGYVFGQAADPVGTFKLVELLRRHRVEVFPLAVDTAGFTGGSAFVVPTHQPQYRLVRSLFERRTRFDDSVFYDVSAWTLPLAMGIPFAELEDLPDDLLGAPVEVPDFPAARTPAKSTAGAVAYAFEWHGYYAPRALNRLHRAGIVAKMTPQPISATTAAGEVSLDRGTVLIPLGLQRKAGREEVLATLRAVAAEDGIRVHTLTTGLTPAGVDLGSPSVLPLEPPRPLLVVGRGVSAYEAGEVWHLLDHRHDIGVTLVEMARLGSVDLGEFTHLLLVNGSYEGERGLTEKNVAEIKRWVEAGGVLVATQSAAGWAAAKVLGPSGEGDKAGGEKSGEPGKKSAPDTPAAPPDRRPYADYRKDRDSRQTTGAIFAADLDLTHPLGFGYRSPDLAVFRNSNRVLPLPDDPYATVARYAEDPLIAGYVHPESVDKFKGTAALTARRAGRGAVISFAQNPNFRAVWSGTAKLYLNAVCFGSTIQRTGPVDKEDSGGDDGGHGHRHQ